MLMLYFSATGNSRYIARLFSAKMKFASHSIEENTDFEKLINKSGIIAFCYPIYGSRVPRPMREFVSQHIDALRDKKLIIFCTQAMFSGDGARALTDLLPKNHVDVIYAEHFTMPNNISNFFPPLQSDAKVAKILQSARNKLGKTCINISRGIVKKHGFNNASKALGLIQGAFWPRVEKICSDKVWIDDGKCTLCGLCAKICPTKNLQISMGEIITSNDNCALCSRCMNRCPQKAIAVVFPTLPKKQYRGV